jgi:hypothetical protein
LHTGQTFNLSLPLDFPGGNVLNPRRQPPVLRPTLREGKANMNYQLWCDDPSCTDVICDDLVIMHLQYSTQWDSLAHVGSMFDANGDGVPEAVYYNGFRAGTDDDGPQRQRRCWYFWFFQRLPANPRPRPRRWALKKCPERCVQGRAVMIDLHAHFGRERVRVGYDLLMDIMRKDGVVVEPGDMVCLHTGFAQMLLEMNKQPDSAPGRKRLRGAGGRDERLLQWITDSGLVALIADNYAVEGLPASPRQGSCGRPAFARALLVQAGRALGRDLAPDPAGRLVAQPKRARFLLTAPPLRLPGAIGSPATPIATV